MSDQRKHPARGDAFDSPSAPVAPSRRRFLTHTLGIGGGLVAYGATGGAALAATAGGAAKSDPAQAELPEAVRWKEADAFVLHGRSPITLESKRSAFGSSGITPANRLYVRNNLPVPDARIVADPNAWELTVEGVEQPRTLSVAELKTMGLTSVAMVLQCSGNGRGFFAHETSGSQWRTGAAGNVIWSGVPLKTVVEALGGPVDGVKFVTSTGGEALPEGLDPDLVQVERSIPVDKGLDDVLLAWEMNGAPIPLAHGGPLRVIVPGYYGCNNVKYVKRVALTSAESTAKIQQTSYRIRPIGVSGAPDQPSMWDMNVKSWITGPGADESLPVKSGRQVIHGVAFGGNEAVESVDVSIDGGKTWETAELIGPDMGPYAWRTFALETNLPAGTHRLASRATSASGERQPEARQENERGYGNNSWRDHALMVEVG
ncbi:sulfite oxidase [Salinisphaera sp. T31B1]|uniref:SorT family sulfite dehydrogenase catalytic subunit n=1 Tax=Salinisphaera sp. T31B1 TaxID=727963 RepID=UPI00333F8530